MKVDTAFLKRVQGAGWQITAVGESHVTGACQRAGCALKVKLVPGRDIPQTCKSGDDLAECEVSTFNDAREFMRRRREQLGLTIVEVEEVAGIAQDFLAKFEKDDPSKIPNAQTFIEWVQALGYRVVLRPDELPGYALQLITETRPKQVARVKRFRVEARRRAERVAQAFPKKR